jgi:hypothetical protein
LARRFYLEVVAPLVADTPHAAALVGDGSEVLGYDDTTSTDHNFGPRLQLFVDGDVDAAALDARLTARLPGTFDGFSVVFPIPGVFGGEPHHQALATTAPAFFEDLLAFDPTDGVSLADWLVTPTQRLASLTGGAVFHDPDGRVEARRAALVWYPDDVWRYVLAAAWLRIGQEQAFVGRTGGRGDELGSRVVAARLVRELMRLAFLLERRWAPYSKWLGRAFTDLALAAEVGPQLEAALAADRWRDRETALVTAAERLGKVTNELGLAGAVDPHPRRFFDRDIHVVDAEGFTGALCAAIEDAEVAALLARLGQRPGTQLGRLPGAIDQAVDSTDVLTNPARCRAAAQLLGLPG